MEICINITPDIDLKKKIDNLRYHYDRKLLRENYPYICAFGPTQNFVNLKRFAPQWEKFVRKKKRIRLTSDVIAFREQENYIFLNIFQKGELEDIHSHCCDALNLDDIPEFFPHILITRNHNPEELKFIFEELKENQLNFSFFGESIEIWVKETKHWEPYHTVMT